ncbi:unnamed protein product [Closterium sp. NIES-64]|nr:unnamed protein product [Closterium sp. NIES-64]
MDESEPIVPPPPADRGDGGGSGDGDGVYHASAAPRQRPRGCSAESLLLLFCAINMVNYIDRGAIASNGINGSPSHCQGDVCDAGSGIQGDFALTNFQDGLLATAFLVGLLTASPLFAHASKRHNPFRLIALGLLVWTLAVAGCGLSPGLLSLLLCRMFVGVGEASFISLAAPFIDDNAPPGKTAQWLATFYLCIPVGFALGYLYGGVAGPLLGWRGAFLLEALFMLPFVVYTATAAPPPLKGNPVLLPFPLLASLAPSLASLLATPPSTSAFRSALPSATSTGGWLARCWGGGECFCWKLCSCCRLCSTLLLPPLRPSKVTSFSRAPLLLLTLLSISLSRLCIPVGFALGYLYGGVAPLLGWRGAFLLEALFMLLFVLYTATAAPPPLKNNPLLPCCLPRCSGGEGRSAHASVTASAALADDDEERAEGAPSLATSSQVEATTQLKHGDGSLIDDSLSLARNEIFTINVLGYAAYTFVIGAYAYWAPKAMKEIFNEERADALFGGITVVTGVGGTLFGGLMLDRMGATIPNALLLQSRVTVVGAIFCLLAFASPHILLFVLFMALGEFFIFAIQGPANIVSLQCVPSNLRALAIAAATVVAHLLGDVPSPPILGLLQDIVGNWRISMGIFTAVLLPAAALWAHGNLTRPYPHSQSLPLQPLQALPCIPVPPIFHAL